MDRCEASRDGMWIGAKSGNQVLRGEDLVTYNSVELILKGKRWKGKGYRVAGRHTPKSELCLVTIQPFNRSTVLLTETLYPRRFT